jgi:hypothetical protein
MPGNKLTGPDAKLIKLCDEFLDLDGKIANFDVGKSDTKQETVHQWCDRRDGLGEAITTLVPVTLAGCRAKAAVALAGARLLEEIDSPACNALIRSALAVLSSFAEEANADDSVDAELISICEAFLAADSTIRAAKPSDLEDEPTAEAYHANFYSSLERLTVLSAATPAGLLVKARAAYAALESTKAGMELEREEAAALSTLADLIRSAVA